MFQLQWRTIDLQPRVHSSPRLRPPSVVGLVGLVSQVNFLAPAPYLCWPVKLLDRLAGSKTVLHADSLTSFGIRGQAEFRQRLAGSVSTVRKITPLLAGGEDAFDLAGRRLQPEFRKLGVPALSTIPDEWPCTAPPLCKERVNPRPASNLAAAHYPVDALPAMLCHGLRAAVLCMENPAATLQAAQTP